MTQPKPDMHLFSVPRSALCIFPQVLDEYALHTLPDLPAGSVIVDVGANNGAFVWFSLGRYQGSRVHAYEPHPGTFKRLEQNLKGLPVECHECAVVHPKTKDTARLFEGLNADTECSLRDDVKWPHVSQDLSTSTEVRLFDAADLPPCELLKVDTEGSEVEILTGYKFLKDVEILLVEAHAVGGDLAGQIQAICEIALRAGLRIVDRRGTTIRFVRDLGAMRVAPAAAAGQGGEVRLADLPEGEWFEVETAGGTPRLGRLQVMPAEMTWTPHQGTYYFAPCYKMSHQRFLVPIVAPGQAPRVMPADLPHPLVWGDGGGEYLAVSAMRPLTLDQARAIVGAQ